MTENDNYRQRGADPKCSPQGLGTGRPRRLTAAAFSGADGSKRPVREPSWAGDPGAPAGAPGPLPPADGAVAPRDDHRRSGGARGDLDLEARHHVDPDLRLPR